MLRKSFSDDTNPFFSDQLIGWKDLVITHIIDKALLIPGIIWNFLIDQLTTSMLVESAHPSFGGLLALISESASKSKLLNIVTLPLIDHHYFLPNVDNPKFNLSLGYGRTWFVYHRHLMFVDHYKDSSEEEELIVYCFGRKTLLFEAMIAEAYPIKVVLVDEKAVTKPETKQSPKKKNEVEPIKNFTLARKPKKKEVVT